MYLCRKLTMEKSRVFSRKTCADLWIFKRNVTSSNPKPLEKTLEEAYETLDVPINSSQEKVRKAFLVLAKKYHPDSGSHEANIDKFVTIEKAFRTITKHNTGTSNQSEVDQIVYDIRHTPPQHRHYLSYEGVGIGTPYQRQKQWEKVRAEKAATNVMEHRMAKSIASEQSLLDPNQLSYRGQKHDIKTHYGFDRLVEDLIQESMSKGEFDNLSGKGKPLKSQNDNPYVDFPTHKLNEVLINNGFTPEWITTAKEIEDDIEALKEEIRKDRMYLGPYPLSPEDELKWKKIYESNKELATSINSKINKYNLIVPLISKQKFHVDFDNICEDILMYGKNSLIRQEEQKVQEKKEMPTKANMSEDILGVFFNSITEMLNFITKKTVK